MTSPLPQHLQDEQHALEAEIREAFKGVTREGGISWMEAEAIDGYCGEEVRAKIRASEKERSWEELIDLPDWHEFRSNWSFLDAIGFRYYVAPAMINCSRSEYGEAFCYALTIGDAYRDSMIALIDPRQAQAIARFLVFMMAVAPDTIDRECWERAYTSYWERFSKDADPISRQVYLDAGRIIIEGSHKAVIPLSDCNTWDRLMDLTSHLSEQDGMTRDMLDRFSLLAAIHNRLEAPD